MPRAPSRHLQRLRVGLLCVGLAAGGCLPVEVGPTVQGRVLDAGSGAPLAGAAVVVRFDLRPDPRLPERELLGHREAVTDAEGRFRLVAETADGLAAWTRGGAEARVVGVIREGYRCASPRAVSPSGRVTVRLEPAAGAGDRRDSCRPLGARPGEAIRYQSAWQALYRGASDGGEAPDDAELARLLGARATFGFGENCPGPAVDLALAPDGRHAAVALESSEGRRVEVLRLGSDPEPVARVHPPAGDRRRLGWVSARELVLWEPGARLAASGAPVDASQRLLWTGSATGSAPGEWRRVPGDPVDVGMARWQGRAFEIRRALDETTGLGVDTLRISAAGRDPVSHRLPGEACGPRGQYGRPQLRIDASGQRGLDLRFVEGGCHAVSVDFASGDWRRLDSAPRAAPGCRELRRVPLGHLRSALGDYVESLEEVLSRDYMGRYLRLEVPDFPLRTPLRRIDVTSVSGAASPAGPVPGLLEPL
jgi:hypothetical protein